MKLLIILAACLITVTNANFLDDLLKPLKALGEGLSATVKQVVPYTQQVGKQLLKDTATTALSSIGKGLTNLLVQQVSHLFGKRNLHVVHKLLSEAGHVVNKIHQFEELLEHEFNSVAAGGRVELAVQRLDSLLEDVYRVVGGEVEKIL